MHLRRRQARLKAQKQYRAEYRAEEVVAISTRPLEDWSKPALVQLARGRGINASGRWHVATIIKHIRRKADGSSQT